MQEFLKNEQDKYIYYYNDNELAQFYKYQQMPENDELSLNSKQEFFKVIFKQWKKNQINFLIEQILLDVQTFFVEKFENNNKNYLNYINLFKTYINKGANQGNFTVEKNNLNEINNSNINSNENNNKNPNLILYNNINNFTLIQGNNSVQIDKDNNKIYGNENNQNNSLNKNKSPKIFNEESKISASQNYYNTVSINDLTNSAITYNEDKVCYSNAENDKNQIYFKNEKIDFYFFSNRLNIESLINYLLNFKQGVEKEMIAFVQEELANASFLRNESIYFLINSYNNLHNSQGNNKSNFKY